MSHMRQMRSNDMTRQNRFFDYKRLPKPSKSNDPALLMTEEKLGHFKQWRGPFETVSEMEIEDDKRIALLERSREPGAKDLATRLKNTLQTGMKYPSMASGRYMRSLRRRLIAIDHALFKA